MVGLSPVQCDRVFGGKQRPDLTLNLRKEIGKALAGNRRDGERVFGRLAALQEVGLGMNHDCAGMSRRIPRIAQPDQHVRELHQLPGTFDADCLDLIGGLAQPGRVGQQNRQTAERQRHFDMVARRAGDGGYDRSFLISYSIDKT